MLGFAVHRIAEGPPPHRIEEERLDERSGDAVFRSCNARLHGSPSRRRVTSLGRVPANVLTGRGSRRTSWSLRGRSGRVRTPCPIRAQPDPLPPGEGSLGVDWRPAGRGRGPCPAPRVRHPCANRRRSPPRDDPDAAPHGRRRGRSSTERPRQAPRVPGGHPRRGQLAEKHRRCAPELRPGPSPAKIPQGETADRPPREVDQRARGRVRHAIALLLCSLLGRARNHLGEDPAPETDMFSLRFAPGERARRALATPDTMSRRSNPPRRVPLSDQRSRDAVGPVRARYPRLPRLESVVQVGDVLNHRHVSMRLGRRATRCYPRGLDAGPQRAAYIALPTVPDHDHLGGVTVQFAHGQGEYPPIGFPVTQLTRNDDGSEQIGELGLLELEALQVGWPVGDQPNRVVRRQRCDQLAGTRDRRVAASLAIGEGAPISASRPASWCPRAAATADQASARKLGAQSRNPASTG